jgi:hypothetical protein
MLSFFKSKGAVLVLVIGFLATGAWVSLWQAAGSAQDSATQVLTAWIAEVKGEKRLYYSILNENGDTLADNRLGLAGVGSANLRICGVHWTGKRWVVIVDDGEKPGERGLIKVVIRPDGASGWFSLSSTFDSIGDVVSHESKGNSSVGNCK